MIAVVDPKLAWYVSRSAGLVTWALCAAAMVWGLVLSTKLIRRRGLPAWLSDLHSFLGTLALVFCGIHLAALVADDYVHFGARELFVPMSSGWKPGPVAWGIVATYLLLAVQVTSWLRRRMPRRIWHSVHLSSFGLYVAGTIHLFTAGTDATNEALRLAAISVTTVIAVFAFLRVAARHSTEHPARARTPAAATATTAAATPTAAPPETVPGRTRGRDLAAARAALAERS